MSKKLLTYLLPLALLGACSDDMMEPMMQGVPEDGELNIRFAVPEMKTVRTRADDTSVANALMLVFDGGTLAQASAVTPAADLSCTITLKQELRKKTGLEFVFIANSNVIDESFFPEGETLENLKAPDSDYNMGVLWENHTIGDSQEDLMLMSGRITLGQLLSYSSVPLVRNAAKVTLTLDAGDGTGVEAVPYRVYGQAASSPVIAGAYTITAPPVTDTSYEQSYPDLDVSATVGPVYMHPTANASSGDVHVIARLPYSDGNRYYYRLDIADASTVYDIESNHHYELVVKSVGCKGYTNPAEAALHPFRAGADDSGVTYCIHDHAPEIYNMISDGVRELGVPHTVTRTVSDAGVQTFYVKVLDKSVTDSSGLTALTKENFRVTSGSSWMSITEVRPTDSPGTAISGTDPTYGDGAYASGSPVQNPDVNDAGTVYLVTLTFTRSMDAGDLKGNILVTWGGLSREVPVVWDRTFRADQMLEAVKLTINSPSDSYVNITSVDYFDTYADDGSILTDGFIPDEDNDRGNARVKGVKAADNNGLSRNEGLHFPMPYGTGTTYTYAITYRDLGGDSKYTWRAEISDNMKGLVEFVDAGGNTLSSPSGTIEATATTGPTIRLRNSGNSSYAYTVGELILTVTPDGTDLDITYPLTLYHTGFFHKDVREDYVPGGSISRESSYTYYEVVELTDGNYWLDRNLGATSSGLYIEMSDGQAFYGDKSAGGYCYRVAKYGTDTNNNNYQDPEFNSALCPPGYAIPVDTEWGLLRKSSRFHTEDVGSYYTTHFVSATGHGNVYFPKIGYRGTSTDDWQGESRAGYYWTRTPASGMEKAEIGNWLRAFSIVGNATTYINAQVYGKDGNAGYAMPVRCIASTGTTATSMTTDFFVKGVTHVYLYNAAGAAVTEWPGVAITTSETASLDWFNFYYQSTAFDPDNLYVIFNFVDSSDRINTFSKGADGTGARVTTNLSPATIAADGSVKLNLQGWKVIGEPCPHGDTTRLRDYWECILDPTGNSTCVRHNNHNLLASSVQLPQPTWDPESHDLWLVGNTTGWAQNGTYKMTQNRNVYSITLTGDFAAGWKIYDGDWDAYYNYGISNENDEFDTESYETMTSGDNSKNIGNTLTRNTTIYVILNKGNGNAVDHSKTQIFILPG